MSPETAGLQQSFALDSDILAPGSAINLELAPMRGRAQPYLDDPTLVKNIIADGCEKAKRFAAETMRDVREAMGLNYA